MAQNQVTYTIDIDGEQRVLKTLADITKASRDVNKAISGKEFGDPAIVSLRKTGTELRNLKSGLNQVKVASLGAGTALRKVTGTTNKAGVAMQNMNFVIRDSPYFFKDLQLGVLAVGNNINPLIDSFINLKKEAALVTKETGKMTTTFGLLKKSMMGGMGLSLAMSVLVTAIQAVVFSMKSGKAAAKSKKESIEDLTESVRLYGASLMRVAKLESLSSKDIEKKILELQDKIATFNKDMGLMLSGGSGQELYMGNLSERTAFLAKSLRGLNDELEDYLLLRDKFVTTEAADKMVEEMHGLVIAALNGKNAINAYANELKLSKSQLRSLMSLWKEYNDKALTPSGEIADELTGNMKELADSLKITEEDLRAILIVFNDFNRKTEVAKDNIKALKDVSMQFNTMLEYMNYLMGLQGDLRSRLIEQRKAEMEGWRREAKAQDSKAQKHKQEKNDLKMLTTISNQLGNAISNAMMTGELAIGNFIKAVLAAIAQMLILKFITNAIFGGTPMLAGLAGGLLGGGGGGRNPNLPQPSIPSPMSMNSYGGGSGSPIEIVGKITVDKNKFVADINNARDSYNNNKRFIRIGR